MQLQQQYVGHARTSVRLEMTSSLALQDAAKLLANKRRVPELDGRRGGSQGDDVCPVRQPADMERRGALACPESGPAGQPLLHRAV